MPQVVPSLKVSVDVPSNMAEKPNNGVDEVGDEEEKETDEDEYF